MTDSDSDAHLPDPHRYPHTRITFIHAGRRFVRSWQHRFTRPTILRLARQFVADITQTSKEHHHP